MRDKKFVCIYPTGSGAVGKCSENAAFIGRGIGKYGGDGSNDSPLYALEELQPKIDILEKYQAASRMNPDLTLGKHMKAYSIPQSEFMRGAPDSIKFLNGQSSQDDVALAVRMLKKTLHHRRAKLLQHKLSIIDKFKNSNTPTFGDFLASKKLSDDDFLIGLPKSLHKDVANYTPKSIKGYEESLNNSLLTQYNNFKATAPDVSADEIITEFNKPISTDKEFFGFSVKGKLSKTPSVIKTNSIPGGKISSGTPPPPGGTTTMGNPTLGNTPPPSGGGTGIVGTLGGAQTTNPTTGGGNLSSQQGQTVQHTNIPKNPTIGNPNNPVIPLVVAPVTPPPVTPPPPSPTCSSGGSGSGGGSCSNAPACSNQSQSGGAPICCNNQPVCNTQDIGDSGAYSSVPPATVAPYLQYGDADANGTTLVYDMQKAIMSVPGYALNLTGIFDAPTLAAVQKLGSNSPFMLKSDYDAFIASLAQQATQPVKKGILNTIEEDAKKAEDKVMGVFKSADGSCNSESYGFSIKGVSWKGFENDLKKISIKGAGEDAVAALKVFNKFDPITLAVRGVVLLCLDVNMINLAHNMSRMANDKDQTHWNKIANQWSILGGDPNKLKESINNGNPKKAFMASGGYSAAGCTNTCTTKTCSSTPTTAQTTAVVGASTAAVAGTVTAATGGTAAPVALGTAAVITSMTPIIADYLKAHGETPNPKEVPTGDGKSGLSKETLAALKAEADAGKSSSLSMAKMKKPLIIVGVVLGVVLIGLVIKKRMSAQTA